MNTLSPSGIAAPASIKPFLIEWLKPNSLMQKLLLTTGAAVLFAASSSMSIPMQPVPFTLQSMMVLLIGAALGRKLAILAMLQVIIMGFVGLPMFADGSNSYIAFLSPSAGYIYGLIMSAYLAGWAAEKGLDRNLLTGFAAFAVAHQIIFVVGVVYLSFYLKISMMEAFTLGYLPFLGFDAIKFLGSALIMFLLWHAKKNTKA